MNADGTFPAQTIPIDDRFRFVLTSPATGGSTTVPPTVTVDGYIHGVLTGAAGDPNFTGTFTGTANWAQLATANPNDPVPADLKELALHPERIHIQGLVNGTTLQAALVLDAPGSVSPPAIPEPSTFAIFVVVMGGALLRLRRARVV